MNTTIRRLDSVHAQVSALVASLDSAQLSKRPAENEWSVSEVLHHLYLVEQRVLAELQNNLSKPPVSPGFLKNLIPMRIISWRIIRVKAPKVVNPIETINPAESLNGWELSREQLKELCRQSGSSRLKNTVLRHPFLGNISGLAAVSMVGFHEQRHYKQIKEILKKLGS